MQEKMDALHLPHIAPLENWRIARQTPDRILPHFDPMDGGTAARLLLLLETPGPRGTTPRFVSRDNPTGTARNIKRFMNDAGIDRAKTILWNCVPWVIHAAGAINRAPRREELQEGLQWMPDFLSLLPDLKIAVLAGRYAAAAQPIIEKTLPAIRFYKIPHPSPVYINTRPELAPGIVAVLKDASAQLDADRYRI